MTDLRDAAQAHVLAAQTGRPGERYLLTGQGVGPKELSLLVSEIAGVKPPTFRPPTFLMRLMGRHFVRKARRHGGDTPADADASDGLAGGQLAYDSTRSRSELGVSYRPARELLVDTARWLLHVNALEPAVAQKVRTQLGARAEPDADWAPV
ncbi:MAG TPA: hypothetical protein VF331_27325 [Polyangiales bacterium]